MILLALGLFLIALLFVFCLCLAAKRGDEAIQRDAEALTREHSKPETSGVLLSWVNPNSHTKEG